MNTATVLSLSVLMLSLAACSDEPPANNVLSEQSAAIDKAEQINQVLDQAAEAQRKAIDTQSQ